jgi:hypothetical protein
MAHKAFRKGVSRTCLHLWQNLVVSQSVPTCVKDKVLRE